MKRILTVFIALALIGIHSPAFAGGWESGKWASPKWSDGAWAGEATTNLSVAKSISGLTFFADYAEDTLTAGYASGSDVATFAASRSASNPATYIDADGVLQLTTTSNVGRFTKGYYDTTGFHSREGVLIEGAATNLCAYSTDISSQSLNWNLGDVTTTQNNAIAPDGTLTASKITATGAGTYSRIYRTAVSSTGTNTYSVWLKNGTVSTQASLRLQSSGGVQDTVENVTLISGWARYSFTATTDSANTNLFIYLRPDGDGGDAATAGEYLYAWGAQLEASPYATSFIPTTAAALTRNKETLKYVNSGNRTAATEAWVGKVTTEYADGTPDFKVIIDTDTKRRFVTFSPSSNDVEAKSNHTDSSDSSVADLINESYSANQEIGLGYNMQSGVSPYIACFYNGVADGTNEVTDDFTPSPMGTYFYMGITKDSTLPLDCIIQWIGFWNRPLTATEHLKLYTDMD